MNNIAHHQQTGLSPHRNPYANFQAAGYMKAQSFKAQESLQTGLVIETKEGDKITLNSNSFSQIDAFRYDSKGVVRTEGGQAYYSQSQREITLASGESFSFSVQGDLSEEELEDIEDILKGVDEVISDMKQGDMKGALHEALEMGDYDTVSAFSADIRYQVSYEMVSQTAASVTQSVPVLGGGEGPKTIPPHGERGVTPEKKGPFVDFEKFFKKLMKQFEDHEEKQVGFAKDPIEKLFQHHLEEVEVIEDEVDSLFGTLEKAMDQIGSVIDEMMGRAFGEERVEVEDH